MLDNILLRIAKSAIMHKFDPTYTMDKEALLQRYPYLQENIATFVTLNHLGKLRGCIGSIIAHRNLLDDISHNAVAAAFNDPRFAPLHADHLSELSLEVSVLTTPAVVPYKDFEDLAAKIKPHQDGLILRHGTYQGTFLPQVWEELPSPKDFLDHLSYKAGADPSIYEEHPDIFSYQVEAIKEKFDDIELVL